MDLLIGADKYWDIVLDKIIRGDGPTAVASKIGYLLSGPIQATRKRSHILNLFVNNYKDSDLERFWNLESIGITPEEESTTGEMLQNYQKNSITFKDGRYIAKLPWVEDQPPLSSNFHIARKRTENVIRRLRQEPTLLRKYGEIIADQEQRGFIEKVDGRIDSQQGSRIHYIPHHCVRKDSATTPIRIVYDCSCRMSGDQSITSNS